MDEDSHILIDGWAASNVTFALVHRAEISIDRAPDMTGAEFESLIRASIDPNLGELVSVKVHPQLITTVAGPVERDENGNLIL